MKHRTIVKNHINFLAKETVDTVLFHELGNRRFPF